MNSADLLARMGAPLDPRAYDWDAAAAVALSAEEVFQLIYAAQVEWGTEGTYASLDVSGDPVVRRFLPIWLDQEVVHAQLLARFLAEQGVDVEPLHRTPRQRFAARRGWWLNRAAIGLVGSDFAAVHMTWGAVNELTTLRFYTVLRNRTRNAVLRRVLDDVIAQEAVHFAFYRATAIERLRASVRAQRITRWAMTHLWSPVGVGLRSREDAIRLMHGVFAGEDELVARMDAQIERLPGLRDLALVRGVITSAAA